MNQQYEVNVPKALNKRKFKKILKNYPDFGEFMLMSPTYGGTVHFMSPRFLPITIKAKTVFICLNTL